MNIKTLKRVIKLIKPYKMYLLISFFSSIIGTGFTLVSPVLIGKSIDLILGPGSVDFYGLFKILLLLSLMVLIGSAFQWVFSVCANRFTYKIVENLRKEVFEKVTELPLKYIDSKPHGDIISRIINDVDSVADGLLQTIMQLFSGVITIIGTFLFMLYVNPVITIVVVILTPLSLFIAMFVSKKSYKFFKEQSDLQGKMTAYVSEMFSSQKIVKSYSYEKRSIENKIEFMIDA